MTLRCDCWIPRDKEEDVRALLKESSSDAAGDEQVSAVPRVVGTFEAARRHGVVRDSEALPLRESRPGPRPQSGQATS